MFLVNVKNPVDLRGEKQSLYHELNKRYGIAQGIHCVMNGMVSGPNGEAKYWEFQDIMEKLPTYKCRVDACVFEQHVLQNQNAQKTITADLYWPDGLLMQPAMKMEVLKYYKLYEVDGGGYLCLCKSGGYYFQVKVIVS